MRKEYETPFCKVVAVEKQDILTASPTTSNYAAANKGGAGNFDSNYGGAFVNWNSNLWG